MPNPLALALVFRQIRSSLGLTQEQLAGLVGVHANAIIRWEGGKGRPAAQTRGRLLASLAKVDAAGAAQLAKALQEAEPPRRGKGQPAAPVAEPAPPPKQYPKSLWVEQGVLRIAATLDVKPSAARAAALTFLDRLVGGHVTVDEAVEELKKAAAAAEAAGTASGATK
jgi:transcriptional regulator with XRE-family HTH domain